MTDDERLIEEVTESVDPMLRWLAAWHSDGFPVEVNGKRRYLRICSPALFTGSNSVQVQDKPDNVPQRVDSHGNVMETINITVVKMTEVKLPAPDPLREQVRSKIFG